MSVDRPLRIGIKAASTLTLVLTASQALSANLAAEAELEAATQPARPLYASLQGGAFPFSTIFGVEGETGAFEEEYWPVKINAGIIDNVFVKYVDVEVSGLDGATVVIPAPSPETDIDPTLTYVSGNLDRVTYANGNYRQLDYTGTVLTTLDYVAGGQTLRKQLQYDSQGRLVSVTQSEL
jgi:hypothetical protein